MEKIFGIDLGTTYSCIAYVNEYGQPEVVNNQDSSPVTPSVVAFEEGGNVSVGIAAKETLNSDPDNVCSTIKRQMGKREYKFYAFDQEYTPEAISALILTKLTKDAGEVLGEEVKNVVITCPAYFGLEEREATKNAGEIAGLNVLGILNEPTAAAISYGLQVDHPQTVMVYDLGGGTFDVTIIKVENGTIQVIATGGDHMMGGKDWDDAIRQHVISTYCSETGSAEDDIYGDNEIMGDLELKAENAKKQLTQKDKATIKLNSVKVEITREQFDAMTKHLLDSSIKKTDETLDKAAKKNVTQIDKILLVGGSTRMTQVKECLEQKFPQIPVEFCDPDQSVAKGAAIFGINQAAFGDVEVVTSNPSGGEESTTISQDDKKEIQDNPIFAFGGANGQKQAINIVNVISQSVAVRLVCPDRVVRIVNQIYQQQEVPCEYTLRAGTEVANQTGVNIEIFENGSMDEYVDEGKCKLLVNGELGPLPSGLPAGEPIEVIFKIDANGMLSIDASHPASGATKHMEVSLQNSLTKKEVEAEKALVGGLHVQ